MDSVALEWDNPGFKSQLHCLFVFKKLEKLLNLLVCLFDHSFIHLLVSCFLPLWIKKSEKYKEKYNKFPESHHWELTIFDCIFS